jgi:hypothetical protein
VLRNTHTHTHTKAWAHKRALTAGALKVKYTDSVYRRIVCIVTIADLATPPPAAAHREQSQLPRQAQRTMTASAGCGTHVTSGQGGNGRGRRHPLGRRRRGAADADLGIAQGITKAVLPSQPLECDRVGALDRGVEGPDGRRPCVLRKHLQQLPACCGPCRAGIARRVAQPWPLRWSANWSANLAHTRQYVISRPLKTSFQFMESVTPRTTKVSRLLPNSSVPRLNLACAGVM